MDLLLGETIFGPLLLPVLLVLVGTELPRNGRPQSRPRLHLGHQRPPFGANRNVLILVQQSTAPRPSAPYVPRRL
jgi:hypothetical protein